MKSVGSDYRRQEHAINEQILSKLKAWTLTLEIFKSGIDPALCVWIGTTFYPDHTDRNWFIKLVSLYTAGKEMSGFYKKIFIYYVIYIVYIV